MRYLFLRCSSIFWRSCGESVDGGVGDDDDVEEFDVEDDDGGDETLFIGILIVSGGIFGGDGGDLEDGGILEVFCCFENSSFTNEASLWGKKTSLSETIMILK